MRTRASTSYLPFSFPSARSKVRKDFSKFSLTPDSPSTELLVSRKEKKGVVWSHGVTDSILRTKIGCFAVKCFVKSTFL